MRLTIAYSKIKKRNLVLINNATYQRETLSERQPLRIWPRGTRIRVVRVYYPPQVLIIDWFLKIRHKWERYL